MHKTMSLGSCHFILIRANLIGSMSQKDVPEMAKNLAADSRDPQTIAAAETMPSYDGG